MRTALDGLNVVAAIPADAEIAKSGLTGEMLITAQGEAISGLMSAVKSAA